MRILVNGYFYGGNCPPFVHTLKSINPDTKLTNALGVLDDHGINHDYLEEKDLLTLKLTIPEKMVVLFLKKLRLSAWKPILIRRAKILVREFKPDIIINHKVSEKAEIMLKTGFRPQLTYVYGGEVHGDRIQRKELDHVFNESTYILTTTRQMASYLVDKRNSLKDKVRVFPLGYFELDQILNYKKVNNVTSIRLKYGFDPNETIIFDNRSLRGAHAGLHSIVEALKILTGKGSQFKMLFLKGFLGTDETVSQLRTTMKADPLLAEHIIILDEIIPNDQIIDLYYISDAFVSLLPADQFGKCISDALFLDCSLILSDLEAYRSRLGSGPCYIQNQDPQQLAGAIEKIIEGGTYKVEKDVYDNLINSAQTRVRFNDLYDFLTKVVNSL